MPDDQGRSVSETEVKDSALQSPLATQDDDMSETDAFLKAEAGGFDVDEEVALVGPEDVGVSRATPIPASIIVPVWILLSGSIILLNKQIFTTLNFPYPVFLTFYHMVVATIGTRLLRLVPGRFSQTRVDMPMSLKLRIILPMAVLFSASLILSNVAYVHLSVSFVQMLKAFIPVLVLVIQLVSGLQSYNHLLMVVICLTCAGCFIAASGEVRFSVFGLVCQTSAVIVESMRLVLIQVLLKEYKMDPLTSIAMYAPICVVIIGMIMPVVEGAEPWLYVLDRVGIPLLLVNGALAFALNIAGVLLIDSAGSVVLTLSGVCKDILLITLSVLVLGSAIAPIQVLGEYRRRTAFGSDLGRVHGRTDGIDFLPAYWRFARFPAGEENHGGDRSSITSRVKTMQCRFRPP
ncbi:hypothetical protein EHS25_006137 [Saitozyma podzolica]|uniref:Sugar phosphate transporter domain-containing protein n=1 Tax=Saitozyma podzolica TaxID=1890683 RepID=A0A427XTN8_9TREE|nr:hypothetical protein EHS25_006137 [Saitozyma podzolica]